MSRRRVVLGSAVAGFAALNALAYLHVRAMTHFVAGGTRTAFPEELSIAEKLRVVLTGVTVPRPRNASTPAAAGLHDRDAPRLRGLARVPNRGGRDPARAGPLALAGFDEVRRKAPGQRVVILGQSMGAAAALRAVHLRLVKPDGLILEAPFDTMLRTVGNRFTAMGAPAWPLANLLVGWGGWAIGTDAFAHNPVDYARSVTCPAVVISGAHDRRVRPDEARAVFDALAGWKRLRIFEDAGHLLYVKRDAAGWKAIVSELLGSLR